MKINKEMFFFDLFASWQLFLPSWGWGGARDYCKNDLYTYLFVFIDIFIRIVMYLIIFIGMVICIFIDLFIFMDIVICIYRYMFIYFY